MPDLTIDKKTHLLIECALHYDLERGCFRDGALDELVDRFHKSRRSIQRIFTDYLEHRDEENLNFASRKKGVVGRKSRLTPEIQEAIQSSVDDHLGKRTYEEIRLDLELLVYWIVSNLPLLITM
jgi:hypothetical protein